jgi:CO/xanthine dehydrogenase Mo-binding subunit
VAFRLSYLTDQRIINALNAAKERAKWKPRKSPAPAAGGNKVRGRGVAVADRSNTMTAVVAEVEVDKSTGRITVQRITLAHDCGLVVNPNGLTMQIEGNVIHGVSRSLFEEVRFDASGIQSLDWVSYPVAHFPDVPEIDVLLLNHKDMPALGGGEPSLVPIPAAIANAVFDAAGVRLREVPMTPERVLKALGRS